VVFETDTIPARAVSTLLNLSLYGEMSSSRREAASDVQDDTGSQH